MIRKSVVALTSFSFSHAQSSFSLCPVRKAQSPQGARDFTPGSVQGTPLVQSVATRYPSAHNFQLLSNPHSETPGVARSLPALPASTSPGGLSGNDGTQYGQGPVSILKGGVYKVCFGSGPVWGGPNDCLDSFTYEVPQAVVTWPATNWLGTTRPP